MSELRSCVVEAMIRGYHEYQSIWEAEIGENLTCILEPGNVRDSYAVQPLNYCSSKFEVSSLCNHGDNDITSMFNVTIMGYCG